jgi:hypothetical protein
MTNITYTESTMPGVAERRPWTISWGAVFAGVFTALVAQLLLNMLGIGIGAATIDPFYGSSPDVATFSWMAYAWWAGSGVISAFFGGWVAGALVGQWWRFDGAVHGFIAWCIATLVVAFLFAGVLGGVSEMAANIAGPMATQYAANNPRDAERLGDMTRQQFSEMLQSTTGDSATRMDYQSQPNLPAPSDATGMPTTAPDTAGTTAGQAAQNRRAPMPNAWPMLLRKARSGVLSPSCWALSPRWAVVISPAPIARKNS